MVINDSCVVASDAELNRGEVTEKCPDVAVRPARRVCMARQVQAECVEHQNACSAVSDRRQGGVVARLSFVSTLVVSAS